MRQPDQFVWFSGYLERHGAILAARWLISLTTLFLGVAAEIALFSPAGPQAPWARIATVAVGVITACLAGMWWVTAWPTRTLSLTYAIVSDLCIATACVAHAELLAGATGCVAFAALGGYIGFFHGPRMMLPHLAFTTSTVLLLTALIAADGDPALAISKLVLITIANLTVPVGTLFAVQLLNSDAASSHIDPLTGLLNRRGLQYAWPALPNRCRVGDEQLVVMVIDLDHFKSVNDTHGHAAGDRVLTGVSRAIKEACRRDALVARTGGEEFLIADTVGTAPAAVDTYVARIRTAITNAPTTPRVTASIGHATTSIAATSAPTPLTSLADMIHTADQRMYEAKYAARQPGPGRHFRIDARPLRGRSGAANEANPQ